MDGNAVGTSFFLLSSAILGCLGALGDMQFQGCFGAKDQCAEAACEKPITEGAEAAEDR